MIASRVERPESRSLALPLARAAVGVAAQPRACRRTSPGTAQNALLFRTVLLEVAFGLLLSAGALAHGIA